MKIGLLSKAQLSIINKNNFRYPLAVAEKDYLLAIVLKIVYSSKLKDKLVFKGGTAIHHLYLDQLRFSEDLDFTTTHRISISDIKDMLAPHDFLKITKYYPSDYALKVERLKFIGPLGQANSIKLNVDLTQKLVLSAAQVAYQNIYGLSFNPLAMSLKEICAEKIRAINERARFRDFYDLTMVMKSNSFEPKGILQILKQKELRKPLGSDSILANLELATEAMNSGAENLYYRQKVNTDELREIINKFLDVIK